MCGVAEEQLDVLQHELPFGHGERPQQGADRPVPKPSADESLSALLRLGEPRREQLAVQQRAQGDERRRRRP